MQHIPVLKNDVEKYLELEDGNVVMDATLGLGGHALDILKSIGENGVLYAFEQDGRNLLEAKRRLDTYSSQIIYIHDNFRYLKSRVTGSREAAAEQLKRVRDKANKRINAGLDVQLDAVLFDLGLSSPHVDESERGFSFVSDGSLDMRFDQREDFTAADIINTYPEKQLMEIFYRYGEEKYGRRIAQKICERRRDKKFETTLELAEFLQNILPRDFREKSRKIHPATRVFQALRIEVNDELNALKEALAQAMEVLSIGGRIVIISYHSLEDRIVKQFFKNLLNPPPESEQNALYSLHGSPVVETLTKKPVTPGNQEIALNPRSRSAKLRAYKKLKQTDFTSFL